MADPADTQHPDPQSVEADEKKPNTTTSPDPVREALEEIKNECEGEGAYSSELRETVIAIADAALADPPLGRVERCKRCGGVGTIPTGVEQDFDTGMYEADDEKPCPDCARVEQVGGDEREATHDIKIASNAAGAHCPTCSCGWIGRAHGSTVWAADEGTEHRTAQLPAKPSLEDGER